jgi:predicted nucleic acid-binding protein
MVVLDASAALHALARRPADPALLRRIATEDDIGAPHLIDVEVLQVLRRLVRIGDLTADQATDVRRDFEAMPILRFPHTGVADRTWELRHNLTAHDATYVALAEAMGCPLITSDARLAKASGHRADVEVYPHPN